MARLTTAFFAHVNHRPFGRTLSPSVPEDSSIRFIPTTDPDGDRLAHAVTLRPSLGELIAQGDAYVYVPRTNVFGLDSAVIRAQDPSGLTAVVRFEFDVTPVPDVETEFLSIQVLSGRPVLTLHGEPKAFYMIESSPDLRHWTPSDPFLSANGEIIFKPSAPFPSAGFYRARRID